MVAEKPLFLPTVKLIEDRPLNGVPGMVYRTSPRTGTCDDGYRYVIKGAGSQEVVEAEALAYLLAAEVDIPTPRWSFVYSNQSDHLLFGSRMIDGHRDTSRWLKSMQISNLQVLGRIIGFDIWICNPDRNLGGLLGRTPASGKLGQIEIVAIDFEASVALNNKTPLISTTSVSPKKLWPRNELGILLKGVSMPALGWLSMIEQIEEENISSQVEAVKNTLGLGDEWATAKVSVLMKRAKKIKGLVKEVWS